MVSIKIVGLVQALSFVQALGAAGKELGGPIATYGSTLPYTFGIETGRHRGGRLARRAGGAYMFREGVRETTQFAREELGRAFAGGARAIASAKGRIRTRGVENIRKRTPVRSGRLRTSVRELNRPR